MANKKHDCKIKPKGKGLKAFRRLQNFEKQVGDITDKLKDVHTKLKEIINNKNKVIDKRFVLPSIASSCAPKKRSMIADMPERIEIKSDSINFYIDFTIEASIQGEKFDVKASIIYGTNRLLCFTKCPIPVSASDNSDDKECNNWDASCDKIGRCDRLEDKPLIKLSMDRDGIILTQDKFEGELWVYNDHESLLDLHYSILDHILEEAVYWTNENLLP